MFETTIFSIFSGDVHARSLERSTRSDIYKLGPLWDYTCIPGHLAAAGSDARAPAPLEHGLESSFASQLSTVVSACDAQGTEALCTKAVIISVWSTLGHSHNHGCFLPHGFEQLAEQFELLAK